MFFQRFHYLSVNLFLEIAHNTEIRQYFFWINRVVFFQKECYIFIFSLDEMFCSKQALHTK